MSRWKRPPEKNYGALLATMLARRGKVQGDLMRLSEGKVSPQTVSKIASGKVLEPMTGTWEAICEALRYTPDGVPWEEASNRPSMEGLQVMQANGTWVSLSIVRVLEMTPGTAWPLRGCGLDGCEGVVERRGKRRVLVIRAAGEHE